MLKMDRFMFVTWNSHSGCPSILKLESDQPSSVGWYFTPVSVAHHSSVQSWNKRVVSREVWIAHVIVGTSVENNFDLRSAMLLQIICPRYGEDPICRDGGDDSAAVGALGIVLVLTHLRDWIALVRVPFTLAFVLVCFFFCSSSCPCTNNPS